MQLVGDCTDSFDEDGNCINDHLPFDTVTDFAQAVDESDNVVIGKLHIVYNPATDVHSFFIIS